MFRKYCHMSVIVKSCQVTTAHVNIRTSAKCINLSLSEALCVSLPSRPKSHGALTLPCGKPIFVFLVSELQPFTLTYILRSLK